MATFGMIVAAVAAIVAMTLLGHAYLHWRGTHVVLCPRGRRFAAVEFAAAAAALSALAGGRDVHIKRCSLWPRRDCVWECLKQVDDAPDALRPSHLAREWYAGKACVYCRKPIRPVEPFAHQPALRAGDRLVAWHEVRPEELPPTLAQAAAVCWNCYIAETFRARYPELVVDVVEREHRTPRLH